MLLRGRVEGGYRESSRPFDVVAEETIVQPFLLHDVHATQAAFIQPFTYCRPGGGATIDFIWASDKLRVAGVLQPVTEREAERLRRFGLPSQNWPSDHLPLGVVVECKHAWAVEAQNAAAAGQISCREMHETSAMSHSSVIASNAPQLSVPKPDASMGQENQADDGMTAGDHLHGAAVDAMDMPHQPNATDAQQKLVSPAQAGGTIDGAAAAKVGNSQEAIDIDSANS